MAEKTIAWTDQQKQAINARGGDVIVTASAGTGKTAVLSGRCVNIVSDKTICPDVGNILVLTFTDAAAEQMRSRIAEQLKDAFLQTGDSHLRRQLMLLQCADISTIHAFCKRLITEYFYKLDLDPSFAVIDADESRLLKTEVLETTIEWAWQQSNIRAALEQILYRRDLRTDNGFVTQIIELSNFLEGVVSRQGWCERAVRLAEIANPLDSAFGQKQKKIIIGTVQGVLERLRHVQELSKSKGSDMSWAEKFCDSHIEPIEKCYEFLKADDWDKFAAGIAGYKKPATYKPKGLPEPIAELIYQTAKKAVDDFKELSQLTMFNPDYLDRLGSSVGLQTRVLIELVKKFVQLYSQAKRQINCLDFADLEHYALRLLTSENSPADEPIPSETALSLRQRYKHVFVDEYQDINSVQQRILDMVSPGGNVLMVGDVKQSIYAFRGAQPGIFLEQLKLAAVRPESPLNSLRVDLNANFRSAQGILDFVNKIFSRIMTASFSQIDYDESAMLRQVTSSDSETQTPGDEKNIVEFHILDESDDEQRPQVEDNDQADNFENLKMVTSRQRQAAMIARRIRQMVGADTAKAEFQIFDKQQNAFRDVQYGDIVILMRSLAKKADDYVEVLRLADVPVSCLAAAGYFQATEINDIVSLLKVLDNPQRDIELAAVLRSPFFNVSDTELAKIKLHARTGRRQGGFFNQLVEYSRSGPCAKLAARLKGILAQIENWRSIGRSGSLADLIWHIYRQTCYLSFVGALPNGQVRRANLLKLHDRAIQFENFVSSGRNVSLSRFVDFLEKLQQTGQDWSPAEPESAAGNAVRIMSVHKSKGLEFPVVFLAGLEGKFNITDTTSDVLADANYGLGLKVIDRSSNHKYTTAAHELIAARKLEKSLAEEMRILYVATTRAKDRLILTAAYDHKKCRDILSEGMFLGQGPLPAWKIRSCSRALEWILYALARQRTIHEAFDTGLVDEVEDGDLFTLRIYGQKEIEHFSDLVLGSGFRSQESVKEVPTPEVQSLKQVLSRIKESLNWRYKFACVSTLPAKLSVTQLTHYSDEYIKIDYSSAFQRKPAAVVQSEEALTEPAAREIGTAVHLVISQLDLQKQVNRDSIRQTVDRLQANGNISDSVAKYIDVESILRFFESELAAIVLDRANQLWREWPFTFALPASEFTSDSSHESPPKGVLRKESQGLRRVTGDEIIIIQGIIDVLVKTPKGLLVIDFKTDSITAGEVSQRAELYRAQLDLYARAVSAIMKFNVIGKLLYFLTPGCPVKLK